MKDYSIKKKTKGKYFGDESELDDLELIVSTFPLQDCNDLQFMVVIFSLLPLYSPTLGVSS